MIDLTRETQKSIEQIKQEIAWSTYAAVTAYDYANQAWTVNGRYVRCGHPEHMNCNCYGRIHEGEKVNS